MKLNWKYEKWREQGFIDSYIESYISLNIYAEDIEIFSNILCPKTIEYKDRVILSWWAETDEDIEEIKKIFDEGIRNFLSISKAEKAINYIILYDMISFLILLKLPVMKLIKMLPI